MSTNYLALRSSAAPSLTVSTLLGSTIAARSISLQSTTISLGQSTNQSYTNFSNGSFTTGWASTLTGLTSIKDVVLSPNGSVQTILQNTGSTMSTTFTSLNSGSTWAGSTMRGLPTSGALPYQTYGSTINAMTVPSITAITAAPSGTNQLAIASNDLVYASANSGATFAATGLGQNNSPFIYLPFDGSVTDVMGNSAVTATATSGSISYVPGKVGTNAVNLNNSAAVGGTPVQYVRGTWAGASNFTFSGWFNPLTINGTQQMIYSAYQNQFVLLITTSNQLQAFTPSGGAGIGIVIGTTSFTIAANTWYSFTIVYQAGGICSFYVNNTLIGTTTNVGGTGTLTSAQLSLGTYDSALANAFNGYICDFRIYNYAVTNPSGAALINPLVGPIMPFVYLTFDGSTTTDLMGNSTTTASGSPGFVAGQVGSNALDLSTNTAGGTATKNISGTWAGTSNFTVSGWFNAQAIPASSVAMIFSAGTGAATAFQVYITTGGVLTIYSAAAYATSTITTNTWYFFQVVYQSSGTCYVYLNGTQVTTFAGTTLSPIPTTFNIGVYTHTPATGAFRGYIDDIRIYTGAFLPSQLSPVLYSPSHAIGSPNIYLPFENGSVLDVMGYSAISARGTMNFVPGIIGSTALNLANPAGGTAVNYLRGSWAGSPNFTVSFWFNAQALLTGGAIQQALFTAYNSTYVIYITSANQIGFYIPSGGTALNAAITSYTVSINTWYYITSIFQTNGVCSHYVNNTLIGSYTNSGGVISTTTIFSIGAYDNAQNQSAFNGYIDDFKIYHSAVPFSALGPMNYTQAAISNSGAYQVVAAANGGVYTSANSGSTWSQATLASLQPQPAVNTVGGQVITPQLTGLAAATWTQNGVNWAASSSSVYQTLYPYGAFNTVNTPVGSYSWGSNLNTYSTTTPFACTSGVSTMILEGVGATTGEWLQLQTSVPLVIQSYTYGCAGSPNIPQRYYIVGSNDGSTWYPIQLAVMTTNPFTGNFQLASTYITVNQSGTQTITGAQTGSGSFTTYTTTTNAYTYFRFLATNVFGNGGLFEFGELYINFITPPTPLYVAPSATLIANQSLNAITVMPQQTGLVSNTWTTNGISWVASASSVNTGAGGQVYYAFDNNLSNRWVPNSGAAYTTTGNTSGVNTTIQGGIGSIQGDWLQLQSSVPLVMNSYQFATGYNTTGARVPKILYIVGSNDGSTWYPIQYATGTGNPTMTQFYLIPGPIVVNLASTQIYGAGTLATTTYATTTNAYLYFRLITVAMYTTSADTLDIGEWAINFTAYTPALIQSLSMSPSGQYMALTGAGATTPNLTGLTGATGSSGIVTSWTANGITWTSSASNNTNPAPAWQLFNNAAINTWVPTSATYTTAGNTSGVNNTFFTNGASTLTVQGDWAQLQSSSPLIMASYRFGCGFANTRFPKTYYIIGSNDAITWYAIQSGVGAAAPTISSTYSLVGGTLLVNLNSVQAFGGSTITTTTYSATTLPFLYFRLVITNSYSSSADVLEIAEWYINFQSGPTFYSTDYGSSWTRTLAAATIPNANVLATSGNGQYSLQASGQTVLIANNTSGGNPTGSYTTPTFSPALSSATGAVSNAAVSASGQYMVVLTQGSSNNVYYSSNYGVSFTGITLGSTAMVSCAVSADGSYITVANATQVFTLNSNTQGLSITVGNQSGLTNQGQNAVAIGNQAGQINQSANSIVLNASGSAVNAHVPGFFVAPVASAGSSLSGSFAVLGYGTDNQVVQTGVSIRADGTFTGTASFAGNVGFGTTAPAAPLHLFAPDSIAWPFRLNYLSGPQLVIGNGGASNIIILDTYNTITGTRPPLCLNTSGGFVGIGTVTPGFTLDVWGTIVSRASYQQLGAFMKGYLVPGIVGGASFGVIGGGGNSVPSLYLTDSGYVGIGVSAPTFPFTCMGSAACFGWNTAGTTYSDPQFPGVEGISLRTYSGGYGIISTSADTALSLGKFGTGAVAYFTRSPSIGTACVAVGNISVTASTTAYNTSSDSRLKENIQDVADIRSMIDNLRPRTYHFIMDENKENQIGFIAQEVRENYPQYVSGQETETEYLSMDYSKFSPFAISACKDLYNENDALKARVIVLESQLTEVLSRLAALEAK